MISVRQATADDFDCLLSLMLDMERHYLGEAAVAENDGRQRLLRILSDNPPDCFLVALDDDEGIGFATLYETFPGLHLHNTWFMKELYVRASSRGRGAGRLLVRAAGSEVCRRGGSRLEFTAETGNSGARRFYESLGARQQPKIVYRFEGENLSLLKD